MISKTHKPHGRQLNAEVCGCKTAIFRLLSFLLRWYPVFLRSTNLEIHVDRLYVFLICYQIVSFGTLQSFTVCILGDFPSFLSALASNNAFIMKLVKMWSGGTPHVVVGTLKISLDRLIAPQVERKSNE